MLQFHAQAHVGKHMFQYKQHISEGRFLGTLLVNTYFNISNIEAQTHAAYNLIIYLVNKHFLISTA